MSTVTDFTKHVVGLYREHGLVQGTQRFSDFLENYADPRVADWWFMSNFKAVLASVLVYLVIVLVGPLVMRRVSRPFELKTFSFVYNLFLIVLSVWMMLELSYSSYKMGLRLHIPPQITFHTDAYSLRLTWAMYVYFISKLIEFADTFLMVLRKKNSQITFLHIYHHSSMPLLMWMITKYAANGNQHYGPILNCFIHAVMYYYYLATSMGRRVWWKRYVTVLQLAQFFVAISFAAVSLVLAATGVWATPVFPPLCVAVYVATMIILFSNFYGKSYRASAGAKKKQL